MLQQLRAKRAQEGGFTLIELLIAIVVVGILAAVVIVGIGSLTNKGAKSTCQASADAAKAASVVHYANTNGTWPADLEDMVTANELSLPTGVTPPADGALTMSINGITLTMTAASGTAAPAFSCPA
jgi:prepilin-type N-terminal cleavage/methylation domain-containing protein